MILVNQEILNYQTKRRINHLVNEDKDEQLSKRCLMQQRKTNKSDI